MENLISERIRQIMEDRGVSSSAFADAIDVQRSSISHILSGRNKPSLDLIQKILNRYSDINPTWLLTGKGKMKQLNLFGEEEPANEMVQDQEKKSITEKSHSEPTSLKQDSLKAELPYPKIEDVEKPSPLPSVSKKEEQQSHYKEQENLLIKNSMQESEEVNPAVKSPVSPNPDQQVENPPHYFQSTGNFQNHQNSSSFQNLLADPGTEMTNPTFQQNINPGFQQTENFNPSPESFIQNSGKAGIYSYQNPPKEFQTPVQNPAFNQGQFQNPSAQNFSNFQNHPYYPFQQPVPPGQQHVNPVKDQVQGFQQGHLQGQPYVQHPVIEKLPEEKLAGKINTEDKVKEPAAEKKVEKVIIFYSDKTFSVYQPE